MENKFNRHITNKQLQYKSRYHMLTALLFKDYTIGDILIKYIIKAL